MNSNELLSKIDKTKKKIKKVKQTEHITVPVWWAGLNLPRKKVEYLEKYEPLSSAEHE